VTMVMEMQVLAVEVWVHKFVVYPKLSLSPSTALEPQLLRQDDVQECDRTWRRNIARLLLSATGLILGTSHAENSLVGR
jgi:hypothetical protein